MSSWNQPVSRKWPLFKPWNWDSLLSLQSSIDIVNFCREGKQKFMSHSKWISLLKLLDIVRRREIRDLNEFLLLGTPPGWRNGGRKPDKLQPTFLVCPHCGMQEVRNHAEPCPQSEDNLSATQLWGPLHEEKVRSVEMNEQGKLRQNEEGVENIFLEIPR